MALRLFKDIRGVLQVDGCASYNRVCRENALTRIGCWDHARRKFVEASQVIPAQKKGSKISKADVALGEIRKLYAIEKRIKIEPYDHLLHILKHIGAVDTLEKLEALLPWNMNSKAAQ